MKALQPAVLAPVPALAHYLPFSLQPGTNPRRALVALAALADGEGCVAGVGDSLLRALKRPVPDKRAFPTFSAAGFEVPASAHVKRTAQESFQPEAFVVRRSMPWSDGVRAGLVLFAFGRSLDAYEAQLRRMVGAEDGITDALFKFTRPVTGAYFWCPPVKRGRLDLSRIL